MTITPKTHAVQVRRATERRNAVVRDVRVLAYSTKTGDAPRPVPVVATQPVREYPQHSLSGYSDECACEKWADCDYCSACSHN
jgi:hypothetical protein